MCLPIFEVPTKGGCVGKDTLSYIEYQYHYEFVVLSITTILAFQLKIVINCPLLLSVCFVLFDQLYKVW